MSGNRYRPQNLVPERARAVSHRLKSGIWTEETTPLRIEGSEILDSFPEDSQIEALRFAPVRDGEEFGAPGGAFQYRVFRVHVPSSDADADRYLFWDCDGEATVYLDGEPWAGLDVPHRNCPIPVGELNLAVVVGTYQAGIWVGSPGPQAACPCRLRRAYTATRDRERWNLYWDFEILCQLMTVFLERAGINMAEGEGYHAPIDRAPVLLRKLLVRLDRACDLVDRGDFEGCQGLLSSTYREFSGSIADGRVALVGHSHLDLVWLWPENVTYDKAIHTTATVVQLMERYPELTFILSTPHIYREIRQREPALWRQVVTLMEAGRWEFTGGMYLESDVNLPCGEGLARCLLYGQQEFSELTGEPSTVLWLPDVFGYPACLPQLMKRSGIEGFFTTKLSWSAITKFPYTVFQWRSPDGSRVIACQSPVGINDPVTVESVSRCVELHQQTGIDDTVLFPMGYGDGGGGPTEEMLESARRLKSLATVPQVGWTTAGEYFDRLREHAGELPEYEGELYLEYHRGTLTTQGRFKELYRRCERALQLREAARVVAGLGPLSVSDWRRVLFAQFHDALPGSSIGQVYEELQDDLVGFARETRQHTDRELLSAIALPADGPPPAPPVSWVFNPIPLNRLIVTDTSATGQGDQIPGVALCLGLGFFPLLAIDDDQAHFPEGSANVLDNGIIRAEFDDRGMLAGLVLRGRSLAVRNTGFVLCRDYPSHYDAWEIDYATPGLSEPVLSSLTMTLTDRAPERVILEGSATFGNGSSAVLRYILPFGSEHLFVELEVDWAEEHRLLQFVADTAYTGRDAIYGEPFGSVRRRQVPGLPADDAKWEVPGQRWAAVVNDTLSDGLALITEAKYGFSSRDGELRLSLLKAPVDPDPTADRGRQTIRFALGAFRKHTTGESLSTPAAAEALFADSMLVPQPPDSFLDGSPSWIRLGFEHLGSLVPSWTKPAEDGNGVVVRLHECMGERDEALLLINRRIAGDHRPEVFVTDILERPLRSEPLRSFDLSDTDDFYRYAIPYDPYEIMTLKITPSPYPHRIESGLQEG
ncbi:MAG: alpha-mannosidase [Spirochaetaceae bacterium]|nr:alpha-mannosidase [Spirochaetaceae bacterium]